MSSSEYAISLETNRLIKKSTANYKRLKKLGMVREIEPTEKPEPTPTPTPTPTIEPERPAVTHPQAEPEFDERDLQVKMAELTTDMVAANMKKIVKSQKLSDAEYDTLLKKMLYQKLCAKESTSKPTKPTKPKTKKKKYKIVEPSDSDDSDSD